MDAISKRPLLPLTLPPQKMAGVYCLAKFSVDETFYRAKIANVDATTCMAEVRVRGMGSEVGGRRGLEGGVGGKL